MKKDVKGLMRPRRTRYKDVTLSVALEVLEQIGTPHSERAFCVLKFGGIDAAPTIPSVDPHDYCDPDLFRDDYLVSRLLKKHRNDKVVSASDRQAAAIKKFRNSERRCLQVKNDLLLNVEGSPYNVWSHIHAAQRKISRLLGPFSWDRAQPFFGFGPGATTRLPRRTSDRFYKYRGKPHVTFNCETLAHTLMQYSPLWRECVLGGQGPVGPDCYQIVQGNRITTVAKDSDCDRIIAIEPDLNMYFQKGIGGLIRSRLRQFTNVNLDDQLPNKELARLGSVDGMNSTIDLASASDSISMTLVTALLPPDWVSAIEHCRSPYGVLPDGEKILYRKVASMGNGFTFELESLIFWALGSAVLELNPCELSNRFRVYGDDITFPTSRSQVLISLLNRCGFDCNASKTFLTSDFRESCGGHYFKGTDVTPFYIRENITEPTKLIQAHNQYVLWRRRASFNRLSFVTTGPEAAALYRLSCLYGPPKHFIPFGFPEDNRYLGDVGFFSHYLQARPHMKWSKRYQGWTYPVLAVRGLVKKVSGLPYLLRSIEGGAVGEGPLGSIQTATVGAVGKLTAGWWDEGYTIV